MEYIFKMLGLLKESNVNKNKILGFSWNCFDISQKVKEN